MARDTAETASKKASAVQSELESGKSNILRDLQAEQDDLASQLEQQTQAYAAQQPAWSRFAEQLSHLAGYELRRGPHPRDAATALRLALAAARSD